MGKGKFSSVSIPTSMFLRLTKLVGHHGFGSTAEVVKWAIRQADMKIDMMLDKIKEEDILRDIKES